MAKLPAVISAIAVSLRVRRGAVEHVARRLQDAGQLPVGGPRTPAVVDFGHVARLVLAVLLDKPLKEVAEAVQRYAALHAPSGSLLDAISEMLVGDMCADLEIVTSWPEAHVVSDGGTPTQFVETTIHACGVRPVIRTVRAISAPALRRLALALHKEFA